MFLVYILRRRNYGTTGPVAYHGALSDPMRGHPPCDAHLELSESVWIMPGTLKPEDC